MKSKMKTALLGGFTAVVCVVGSLTIAAPAKALSFSSNTYQFDFGGPNSRVSIDQNQTGLDFFNTGNFKDSSPKGAATGGRVQLVDVTDVDGNSESQFLSFLGSIGTINDVLFTDNSLSNFINIDLIDEDRDDSGVNLIFDLTEAVARTSTNPTAVRFKGILSLVDANSGTTQQKNAVALLTTQINGSGASTFSITAVPTPAAVLPALIGMGTAAFRKKKQEGEEELATVGVKEA